MPRIASVARKRSGTRKQGSEGRSHVGEEFGGTARPRSRGRGKTGGPVRSECGYEDVEGSKGQCGEGNGSGLARQAGGEHRQGGGGTGHQQAHILRYYEKARALL